jgi:hypothetical protein
MVNWRNIALFLLFFCLPDPVVAQYPNIRVSAPGSNDPEEVTIAVNPAYPLNLAAGANIDYDYHSTDGGLTWDEGNLSSSLGVWGDPCVTFDIYGNLYYAHLSNPPQGDWLDRVVVQKSTDGGLTWDDGVGVGLNPPKDQDKEWLATDQTDSPFRGNIYMSWTQFDSYGSHDPSDSSIILFSRSTDSGTGWTQPIRVSDRGGDCLDGDNTVEGAVPAVGPGGEVYISWAGPEGIMFDRSTDGGVTFGKDVFIASQPGGWDFSVPSIFRCNGLPITACDISRSPYRGNVYVAWSDQRNGTDDTDVFFITSTDGGKTWGDVVRVNDDTTTSHQFFPSMTVDPKTGIIYLVFYDRREVSPGGFATEVYGARSDDGGATFENFRISETPFYPSYWVFFGDYIHIAARNGKIYPIWMRMDSGLLSVWTAIIEEPVGIGPSPDEPRSPSLELSQNYPNPFNPVTKISYRLPRSTEVELSIYNTRGQLVKTLVTGYQRAGSHTVTWKAEKAASGVYFYRLDAGGKSMVRKCIISK